MHDLSTVCLLLTTRIRDTTNTNQTHAITKIFIFQLTLNNSLQKHIYFTLNKSFIEVSRSLHAASIAAIRKLF